MPTTRVQDSEIGDFRAPEVIAAAERGYLFYLDDCKGDSMLETEGMKEREKEIPVALAILDKELEEQNNIIKSLREALYQILRDERPLEVAEDKAISPPDSTELGSKVRSFNRRLMINTEELRRILDDLEL